MTLIAGIDDATGKVPWALFREEEDAQGYFLLLREMGKRQGIPLAIYHDRHGIFERSALEGAGPVSEARSARRLLEGDCLFFSSVTVRPGP